MNRSSTTARNTKVIGNRTERLTACPIFRRNRNASGFFMNHLCTTGASSGIFKNKRHIPMARLYGSQGQREGFTGGRRAGDGRFPMRFQIGHRGYSAAAEYLEDTLISGRPYLNHTHRCATKGCQEIQGKCDNIDCRQRHPYLCPKCWDREMKTPPMRSNNHAFGGVLKEALS